MSLLYLSRDSLWALLAWPASLGLLSFAWVPWKVVRVYATDFADEHPAVAVIAVMVGILLIALLFELAYVPFMHWLAWHLISEGQWLLITTQPCGSGGVCP
jgi:hypothetical protein